MHRQDKTRHLFLRSTNKKTLSIYRSLCTIVEQHKAKTNE